MGYSYAANLSDLKMATTLRVVINQEPILLVHDKDTVFAMDDRCPHMKASLAEGTYEDGVVTCKRHHAKIDVRTGNILQKAKIGFIKLPTKPAKTYKIKIDNDDILVLV